MTLEDACKIAEIVQTSENWNEIEAKAKESKIEDAGYFTESHPFYAYLFFAGCNAAKSPKEGKKSETATIVQIENKDYHIHGIAHLGNRKEYVSNLKNIERLVCETGIGSKYKLRAALEQARGDEMKYIPLADYGAHILQGMSAILISRKAKKAFGNAGDERMLIITEGNKISIGDAWLPERHEHEIMRRMLNQSRISRTNVLRSLSQAELLENIAKNSPHEETHGLYGMGHEPHISYFLRFPEKANELKERFRKNSLKSSLYYGLSMLPFAIFTYMGIKSAENCAGIASGELQASVPVHLINLGICLYALMQSFCILENTGRKAYIAHNWLKK